MPFTVIPMAINIMSGIALWTTDLSLTAKIIITALIVLKYAKCEVIVKLLLPPNI